MLCLIAVLTIYHPVQIGTDRAQQALEVCREVEHRAKARAMDPLIPVAVAAEESRFTRKIKSQSGAVGPLQILPIYWCPTKGNCNEIEAGLDALEYFLEREGHNETRAFTRYAGAGPRARAYARRVQGRLNHLRRSMKLRAAKP